MYGISFKGSKSKIAKDIIEQLPSGNRLVDLFGGGGAISHCAVLSGKWNSVLYNDINPLIPELLQDAINGKYDNFIPEFIDRERFNKLKSKDGYIKYVWSYGSNGQDYLYSKDKEPIKHAGHDLVVFGKKSDYLENVAHGITDVVTADNITDRRLQYAKYMKLATNSDGRLQHLERIIRLQNMTGLSNIQFSSMDYREYKYQDGDVVYCDIPYFNCEHSHSNYDVNFNHGSFYEWCISQTYPVYISMYSFITEIWHKQVRSVMNSGGGGVNRLETLYRFN